MVCVVIWRIWVWGRCLLLDDSVFVGFIQVKFSPFINARNFAGRLENAIHNFVKIRFGIGRLAILHRLFFMGAPNIRFCEGTIPVFACRLTAP